MHSGKTISYQLCAIASDENDDSRNVTSITRKTSNISHWLIFRILPRSPTTIYCTGFAILWSSVSAGSVFCCWVCPPRLIWVKRVGRLLPLRLFGGSFICSWYKIFCLISSMCILSSSLCATEHPGQGDGFPLFPLTAFGFKLGIACFRSFSFLTYDALTKTSPGANEGIFRLATKVKHGAVSSNTSQVLLNIIGEISMQRASTQSEGKSRVVELSSYLAINAGNFDRRHVERAGISDMILIVASWFWPVDKLARTSANKATHCNPCDCDLIVYCCI